MFQIILFLTKTLKRSLVQRILAERQDAVNIYVRYLSTRLQLNEITDILTYVSLNIFSYSTFFIFLSTYYFYRMLGQSMDAAVSIHGR